MWPCRNWHCGRCAAYKAATILSGIAQQIPARWPSSFVHQIYMNTAVKDLCKIGGQNLYAWSFVDSAERVTVRSRLKKQATRLRQRGHTVEFLAAQGHDKWWIISTIPFWLPTNPKGRPPKSDLGTHVSVPAVVALTWMHGVLASGWAEQWSRSRGWVPPGKAKAKVAPGTQLATGKQPKLQLTKTLLTQMLVGLKPEERTPQTVMTRSVLACTQAEEFFKLPDSTPCAECKNPIGDEYTRKWTSAGPVCNRRHDEGAVCDPLGGESAELAQVLTPLLGDVDLSEVMIEQLLHEAGFTAAWFSSDRELLEQALQMAGATYNKETARWESIQKQHHRAG